MQTVHFCRSFITAQRGLSEFHQFVKIQAVSDQFGIESQVGAAAVERIGQEDGDGIVENPIEGHLRIGPFQMKALYDQLIAVDGQFALRSFQTEFVEKFQFSAVESDGTRSIYTSHAGRVHQVTKQAFDP